MSGVLRFMHDWGPIPFLLIGGVALGTFIIGRYRVKRWIDLFVATFVVIFIEWFGLSVALAISIHGSANDNKGLVFLIVPPALLISTPLVMLGLLAGWKLRHDSGTSRR
jgi:hypothetical protein